MYAPIILAAPKRGVPDVSQYGHPEAGLKTFIRSESNNKVKVILFISYLVKLLPSLPVCRPGCV